MLARFYWSLLRISGFFMVVPIFGNRLVPNRVKVPMIVSIAWLVAMVLPEAPAPLEFDAAHILLVMQQLLIGAALGFSAVLFFQLFVLTGQFIGMQMGLGFAAMVDPGNGVSVTVWSQLFLMLVTLSFLALDGHLVLLDTLIRGFTAFPVQPPDGTLFYELVRFGAWMFQAGLRLALPAVVALLIVNVAFGVMNRAAPQLNVFSLGFPFGLLFGLVVAWALLGVWDAMFRGLLTEYLQWLGVS